MSEWVHGQEILLSQGCFFQPNYPKPRVSNRKLQPHTPVKNFSEYTPPGSQPSLDCADKSKIKNYKDEKFIFFLLDKG